MSDKFQCPTNFSLSGSRIGASLWRRQTRVCRVPESAHRSGGDKLEFVGQRALKLKRPPSVPDDGLFETGWSPCHHPLLTRRTIMEMITATTTATMSGKRAASSTAA